MLRCREISKLVSESMDRELPLRVRMQVRVHLMMCRMCAGFARQLRFLRRALREKPERLIAEVTAVDVKLSEPARERIKAVLRDESSR